MPTDVDRPPVTVLCIGSLPPPLGGVTVLFQQLCRDLADRGDVLCRVQPLPLGSTSLVGRLTRMARTVAGSLGKLRGIDVVSLHVPTPLMPWLGIVMLAVARISGKRFVVRKFGGTDYNVLGRVGARLSRYLVRHSDLYLAEAKALVAIGERDRARAAAWFPNNRPLDRSQAPVVHDRPCRRFVFVGHVKPTKGVGELIEAAAGLPDDCSVDVYGPFHDGLTEATFANRPKIRYRGVIQPDEVVPTLARYDALVLATYHGGEGYPGVIHEAYLAGRPVIVSRWGFLPEIVDDGSGLFVTPRDADSLATAMIRLHESVDLYRSLQAGAREKAELFDSRAWAGHFVRMCAALRDGRPVGDGAS